MKKIKLDKLSSNRFDEKELSKIKGGECACVSSCLCRYADQGGSSLIDNANANAQIAANDTQNGAEPIEG